MPHTLEHATQGSLTPQPNSALALPAVHELACFRTSPRPSLNQGLVDQLKPLREWRFLQHGSASTPSPPARGGSAANARSLSPSPPCPANSERARGHQLRDARQRQHRHTLCHRLGRTSPRAAQGSLSPPTAPARPLVLPAHALACARRSAPSSSSRSRSTSTTASSRKHVRPTLALELVRSRLTSTIPRSQATCSSSSASRSCASSRRYTVSVRRPLCRPACLLRAS